MQSTTPFPTLTTTRLTLRQLSESDAAEIFLLRSDPTINKYLDRQPASTKEDALTFIGNINRNIANNESFYWAITQTGNPKLIGTVCLFGFSEANNNGEIGYELLTDHQGQGIMQEAITAVIEFAFQTLELTTIDAFSHKDNQPSIKLLQKLNFEKLNVDDEIEPNMVVYRLNEKGL